MRRWFGLFTLVLLFDLPFGARADVQVMEGESDELSIGGMAQVLGLGQHVRDPYKDPYRVFLFLKEARFRVSGHHEDYGFNLELALGGEETVAAPSPGV